jgi:hypothetical protein
MDDKDYLDSLLKPDGGAADIESDWSHMFVVPERATSSEEQEATEAALIEAYGHPELLDRHPSWPAPFYGANDQLEPLSKTEKATLREMFGVSPEEYEILYGSPS